MVCTQDSKSVLIGCEDGTMSMFILADPFYNDYVEYLIDWRAEQLNLYSREGRKKFRKKIYLANLLVRIFLIFLAAPSPTPDSTEPVRPNSTALFKGLNVFAQKFDTNGNNENVSNDQNSATNTENGTESNSISNIEAKISPSLGDDKKES
jgi:hypothetical protein